jgi:PST family polysaccharide transporter
LQASRDLKRQAVGGAAWGLARFGAEQVFRFAVFAFLARLLSPADFGVFALAAIFVDIGRILSFSGLSESLIRADSDDDALSETLFWSAMIRTGLVVAGLAVLSVPVALALGQPKVAPVILALGGCLFLEALTTVHSARATRAFRNQRLTFIALACNFSAGAATVTAAYQGLGIWSFVVNQLVYGVLGMALLWSSFPWAPRFRGVSRRHLADTLGFSSHIAGAQVLNVAAGRIQDFVTGRFLGPTQLGQLRVGGRVFDMMYQAMITPLAAVALPTLSRLQDNSETFRNAFSRMAALSAMAACPAMLGFAAVGADAIPLLFGSQWAEVVPVVRILGLVAPAWVLSAFAGPTLTALGRGDTVMRFAMLQIAAVLAISLAAVRFGIVGMAIGAVIRAYLMLPIQLWLFRRATGMGPWAVLRNVVPPMGSALVMIGVLLALEPTIQAWVGQPILRLCVMAPMGAAIYGGVLLLVWPRFLFRQVEGLRSVLGRGAA